MASLYTSFTAMEWGLLLGAISLVAGAWVTLYRLFLHPLASVPGPPLAATTRLYGLYFNVIRGGKFYLEIERLHRIYGPVIRIAPNELHLSDPDNYDKIYAVGSKLYKDPVFYSIFSSSDFPGIFATISNETHRRRRAPLDPFFSRRAVLELESVIQDKVASLCRLMEASIAQGQCFSLYAAFRAVSVDVITEYAFDDCWRQLDRDDLGEWFSAMMEKSGVAFWILQQWPFLLRLMETLPPYVAKRLDPGMRHMRYIMDKTRRVVENIQRDVQAGCKPRQRTIFHNLLDPEFAAANHRQMSVTEMAAEAYSVCAAASETTGNAMTVAAYHVITNPVIYARLREELLSVSLDPSNPMTCNEFEKLPYLTGVVKEGLRLSYGVIGRLPRVVPEGGAVFNGYHVPPGTVVGMSAYMQHRNPEVFPNPSVFEPQRWIGVNAASSANKCFVPFSRGSRGCIGQNLALCELFITLGTVFRRFGDLATKNVGDLTYVDYFNAFHPAEQRLRVFTKTEEI